MWLTEDQARERFESGQECFHVLDPVALNGQPPSYILKISSPPNGRLTSERFNSVGSVLVIAELRPEGGRYFVSRVLSWTYPDSENL